MSLDSFLRIPASRRTAARRDARRGRGRGGRAASCASSRPAARRWCSASAGADADLLFVGEGPGEQEDLKGEPFVGRAGQLLTQLIEGIGLTRDDVYIANVVKCRPPGNRDPQPDEIEACAPWLDRQLALIQPRVIVTLGNFATKLLLDTKEGITKLRGQEFAFSRAGHRRGAAADVASVGGAAVGRQDARRVACRLRAGEASARASRRARIA